MIFLPVAFMLAFFPSTACAAGTLSTQDAFTITHETTEVDQGTLRLKFALQGNEINSLPACEWEYQSGKETDPLPEACGKLDMKLIFSDTGIPEDAQLIKTMLIAGDVTVKIDYFDLRGNSQQWTRLMNVPSVYAFYGEEGYDRIAGQPRSEVYYDLYIETKNQISFQLTNFAVGVNRFQFDWITETDFLHPDVSPLGSGSDTVLLNGELVSSVQSAPYASDMAAFGYTDLSHLPTDPKVSDRFLLVYDVNDFNAFTMNERSLDIFHVAWSNWTVRIEYLDQDGYRRIWEAPLRLSAPLNVNFSIGQENKNNQ